MLLKVFPALIYAASLIPCGYSAFPGSLEVPITLSGYDMLVNVEVGEPKDGAKPQKLIAIFDTGNSATWVVDKDNSFTNDLPTVPFDKAVSSSFKEEEATYTTQLGNGNIEGYLGSDKVKIGDGTNAIVLDSLQFGLAKKIPSRYVGMLFDYHNALFGINLVSKELGSTGNAESFIEVLRKKYSEVPVIGIYINVDALDNSKLTFNGNDRGLYRGNLNTHDVVTKDGKYNGWNVKITKLAVVGESGPLKEITLPADKNTAQIVTRVSPVIMGPTEQIKPLNEQIFSNVDFNYDHEKFQFDCPTQQMYSSRLKQLPKVAIYIDDVQYLMRADQYIKDLKGGKCRSGLYGADINYVSLGEGFIENFYTRLDFEKKQVQFAPVNLS